MKTSDLLDIAVSGRERRQEQADANLWALIKAGNVAAINKQLHEPELGTCDTCGERPGDRIATEARLSICEECDAEEHARMLGRKVIKFRTRDERDAYEAGVRARGEI